MYGSPPVRSRSLSFSLLVFQAVWLNVIVPGHTRGVVQLPHEATFCAECGCATSHPKQAPKAPAGNCAICFFAAHLSIPPRLDFTHTRLDLLHRLEAEAYAVHVAAERFPLFHSRAPPAFA